MTRPIIKTLNVYLTGYVLSKRIRDAGARLNFLTPWVVGTTVKASFVLILWLHLSFSFFINIGSLPSMWIIA